jgi:hypothetical protein
VDGLLVVEKLLTAEASERFLRMGLSVMMPSLLDAEKNVPS